MKRKDKCIGGEKVIRCHYIPQLILRHFCKDNKLTYCDIKNRSTEQRNTVSVFSEKGYYPDELEKQICCKIETQFAELLNKKILNSKNRLILSADELLLLKKFLIITILRVKDDDRSCGRLFPELQADELVALEGDFCDNINCILNCKTADEAFNYLDIDNDNTNLTLLAYMRDILYSSIIFVRTNQCKEDFVIPDRGYASYSGPIHIKKFNAVLNTAKETGDPTLFDIAQMLTPHDYSVFPIAHNMAIITMSPFFKLCKPGTKLNVIFPPEAPTVSDALGFGSGRIVAGPNVRQTLDGAKEYIYGIEQLTNSDVCFLNALLINNSAQYFAYSDLEHINRSIAYFSRISKREYFSFLK